MRKTELIPKQVLYYDAGDDVIAHTNAKGSFESGNFTF